jgi:hypothetical protein
MRDVTKTSGVRISPYCFVFPSKLIIGAHALATRRECVETARRYRSRTPMRGLVFFSANSGAAIR